MEAVTLRLMLIYKRLAALATPDHLLVASGGSSPDRALGPACSRIGLGPSDLLVVGERGDQSRRRAAGTRALGALPDLAAAPASLGESFAPDARASRATSRRWNASNIWTKGMIVDMQHPPEIIVTDDPAELCRDRRPRHRRRRPAKP